MSRQQIHHEKKIQKLNMKTQYDKAFQLKYVFTIYFSFLHTVPVQDTDSDCQDNKIKSQVKVHQTGLAFPSLQEKSDS